MSVTFNEIEQYCLNKAIATGELAICPVCGKQFLKVKSHHTFCCNQYNKDFININDPGKTSCKTRFWLNVKPYPYLTHFLRSITNA